jgi:general secretion pathway protein C
MNGVISHRVVSTFNIALAVVILVLIPLLTRDIISDYARASRDVNRPVAPKTAEQPLLRTPFPEYEALLKNNPFGIPDAQLSMLSESAPAQGDVRDLRLMGTIAGEGKYLYAIVSDSTGRQEVFRVGDSVFGFGTLKDVRKDKVLISREGRTVEVPLVDVAVIEDAPQQQGRQTRGDFSSSVRSMGKDSFVVDQKAILNALENPNQLMTDARLQPNFVNGRQEGFVLREVRQGGMYHNLGLLNGDVLLRINSMDISQPDNALQAFTALRGADRVALDIVRSGAKTTLTYQIR